MSLRTSRSVAWVAVICCAFVLAGCSKGKDGHDSSAPPVASSGTVVGSWVARLGDRDNPDEVTLELRPDGTAVGTDRCNFIQANWSPAANPSKIIFTDSIFTTRLCPDRTDVIGFLTSARLDERDQLILNASGREWKYERR